MTELMSVGATEAGRGEGEEGERRIGKQSSGTVPLSVCVCVC